MSSSDSAMFTELQDRVTRLEGRLQDILERLEGKDMMEEAYAGSTHAEDPIKRGPGRPPNQRV